MSQVSTKEPLFHIVKREGVTFVQGVADPSGRHFAGAGGLRVRHHGHDGHESPERIRRHLERRGGHGPAHRGSPCGIRPILLCIGFAVLPAFRMRFWNIGAEGQVLVGGHGHRRRDDLSGADKLPSWALYALCR